MSVASDIWQHLLRPRGLSSCQGSSHCVLPCNVQLKVDLARRGICDPHLKIGQWGTPTIYITSRQRSTAYVHEGRTACRQSSQLQSTRRDRAAAIGDGDITHCGSRPESLIKSPKTCNSGVSELAGESRSGSSSCHFNSNLRPARTSSASVFSSPLLSEGQSAKRSRMKSIGAEDLYTNGVQVQSGWRAASVVLFELLSFRAALPAVGLWGKDSG